MDTTLITNYFELYGGLAIFVIVLLEYLNLPGFPARDYHAAGWCLCRKRRT